MNKPLTYHWAVPTQYYGVWRRSLLENSRGQDTESLVLWMQTRELHADIRIPPSRPDFSDYACLEECAIEDLMWLASQQGFYGVTHVNADICQWQRQFDFQPKNGSRDIGKVAFTSANEMLETGVDDAYLEVWQRVEDSHLKLSTHTMKSLNRIGESVPAFLLCAGQQVAYVRPRKELLPEAASLLAAIQLYEPTHEKLLDWLDFEISFGQMVDESHWQIRHSTHPFLEGKIREKGFYV